MYVIFGESISVTNNVIVFFLFISLTTSKKGGELIEKGRAV